METQGVGARAGLATLRVVRKGGRLLRGQMVEMAGGPARAHVVFLFGCVLGLSSADTATVGAVAPQLEQSMKIGNFDIGLLSSAALLIGAIFVLPVGMLVDRARRVPLLAASVVLWSIASLASALSGSFSTLLLTRLALGAVAATAGPAIASLTGDYFPARERGSIYSYILAGEGAGATLGFIVSGAIASAISWRGAFVVLAIPGFFLARSLWRTVPEPHRGGQSRLRPGALTFEPAGGGPHEWDDDPEEDPGSAELAHDAMDSRGVEPNPRLVLRSHPSSMRLDHAIRYILSIPTNVTLIISSALGYFFFAGLETFAILFIPHQYHIGQNTANLLLGVLVIGYLIGTVATGRLTDVLLRRGFLNIRIWLPAICYLGATALLIPGVLGKSLTPALWFDTAGAALLGAANPPLDAARLDIMHAGLWGRAESTRTFLRSIAQALAPLLFGGLSVLIAGINPEQAPVGTRVHSSAESAGSAAGLEATFLIMLVTVAAAGVFLLRARRTYPTDVATAGASQRRNPTSPADRPRQGPEPAEEPTAEQRTPHATEEPTAEEPAAAERTTEIRPT